MRFLPFTAELADIDKIVVDGNGSGRGLQLSHWPGNTTPQHLKADLSVEIVLRFLADPGYPDLVAGRDIVTNDHYDTDGLLAIWATLNPATAAEHHNPLVAAAETGDFYEFTTPSALQFDLLVDAFADPDRSPIAAELSGLSEAQIEHRATEALLAELPGLLYDTGRYAGLWRDAYETIVAHQHWLAEERVRVWEWPEQRLSTIRTPERLDRFARHTFARGHRILEAITESEGTRYALHYREFLWYDIVSRTISPRHAMTGTAERLNELEPDASSGAWVVTKWTPALMFVATGPRETRTVNYKEPQGLSQLPIGAVEKIIRDELTLLDGHRTAMAQPGGAPTTVPDDRQAQAPPQPRLSYATNS